jgi:type II secretory pathway component PulJ
VSGNRHVDGAADPGHRGGVSLADLLVSLAVLGLVLTATVTLLEQGQRLHARGAARVEAQQSARVALARMATEIRQAGFGPEPGVVPAISVAEPTRIVLNSDLDGDGVLAATKETITWALVGDVLRRNAGAGAQPVINGVRELVLEYHDAHGEPTADPAAVHRVTIRITTEPHHAAADPSRRAQATFVTDASLRNR